MESLTFDPLSVVISVGIIHGFFLASVFLFYKKGSRRAHRFMAALLATSSISIFYGLLMDTQLYLLWPHALRIGYPFQLLLGPFFYLYVKEVSAAPSLSPRQRVPHFLPFIAAVLLLIPYYLLPGEEKIRLIREGASGPGVIPFWAIDMAIQVQIWAYLIRIYRMVQEHEAHIRSHFSNLSRVSLGWIKYFLYGLAGIFLLVMGLLTLKWGLALLNIEQPLFEFWDHRFVPIAVSLCLYTAGYRALMAPDILTAEGISRAAPAGRRGMDSELSPLKESLLNYMETEQPYRNPDITLPQLAQELGLTRNLLSRLLNEGLGINFFDFINQYRVDCVKAWLRDPAKTSMTILGMAMDAGFNSKGTFNAAFRKHTGLTPSQFRKKGS